MSYFCRQCGTKVIDEESMFCHKCGAALAHAFADTPKSRAEINREKPIVDNEPFPVGKSAEESKPAEVKPIQPPKPIIKYSPTVDDEPADDTKPILGQEKVFTPQQTNSQTSLEQSKLEQSKPESKSEKPVEKPKDRTSKSNNKHSAKPNKKSAKQNKKAEKEKDSKKEKNSKKSKNSREEKSNRVKRGNPLAAAVFSMLLAILLFLTLTAGQTWFVLQNGINNKTIKTAARAAVESVDFGRISIPGFVNDKDVSIPGVDPYTTLPEAIYATIDDYYREIFGVDKDNVQALLESEGFRGFFSDILDGGIDYIMGQDETSQAIVTSDKITELIRENQAEIESITSYTLVESDFEDIKTVLQSSGIDELTWVAAAKKTDTPLLRLIRKVFSFIEREPTITMVCVIAAVALPILLLVIIHRRRVSGAFLYFGIPALLSGGIFVAGNLVGVDLLFKWSSQRLGISREAADAVKDALSVASDTILYSGIVVAGAGVIAIVAKIIAAANRGN